MTTAPGGKGERTKRRIIDATSRLLDSQPFNTVRITDITREAGVVQPTFYTYFNSIEDVILILANQTSTDSLAPYFERSWRGKEGLETARSLVSDAIDLLNEFRSIFSITDVLANQGNKAFASARARQMRTLYRGFEQLVRDAQKQGHLPEQIEPRLAGYECVALLLTVAVRRELLAASGFSSRALVDTTSRILQIIATGNAKLR